MGFLFFFFLFVGFLLCVCLLYRTDRDSDWTTIWKSFLQVTMLQRKMYFFIHLKYAT